jgi:DNA-binding winged helix-turn-helix (wHTH) protein/tetratricopeptide (TPR) repeat protein
LLVDVRAAKEPVAVCFGDFDVNLRSGDIRRHLVPIALQEQPLRVLIRLLETPGELVTRDELRVRLWSGDTFVDFEHGLNAAIKRLRDALGDSANEPRFIETIPHRGYRFVAPVHRRDDIPLPQRRRFVGRSTTYALAVMTAAALAVGVVWWRGRAPASAAGRPPPQTIVPAAYRAYLQGLYAGRRWQAGGCIEAERHLREAISIDPTFADAYARLADCYVFPDRTRRPGSETFPKARAAAERALALDPESALAHEVLGRIHMHDDFDWPGAERELRHAADLNPADSQALMAYGELLLVRGRPDAGLAAIRDALRFDPLNLDHQVGYAFALRNLRRFDEAAASLRATLESDRTWTPARFWLAYTEADRGQHDAAVAEYLAFLHDAIVPPRVAAITDELRRTYERLGWTAFWQSELALAEADNRSPGSVWQTAASYHSGPFSMARRYARLGNTTAVVEWLERSFDYRHHLMIFIGFEPLFDALRAEPRFRALQARMRL